MTVSRRSALFKAPVKKMQVIQSYTLERLDCAGYNQFLDSGTCKIEISLPNLIERKNTAFKRIIKQINYYFLIEYTCALLQEQGIWKRKFCVKNSTGCKIQNMYAKLNMFL